MSALNVLLSTVSSSLCKSYLKTSLFATSTACRWASKKTGGSSRNTKNRGRPKHRGLKVQDGVKVSQGTILVKQMGLRFHPGLNVGFGRNGNLFALEAGTVAVTCEKINPNMNHTWIQRIYGGRDLSNVYKKYLNVLNEPQHCRFKLVETI